MQNTMQPLRKVTPGLMNLFAEQEKRQTYYYYYFHLFLLVGG